MKLILGKEGVGNEERKGRGEGERGRERKEGGRGGGGAYSSVGSISNDRTSGGDGAISSTSQSSATQEGSSSRACDNVSGGGEGSGVEEDVFGETLHTKPVAGGVGIEEVSGVVGGVSHSRGHETSGSGSGVGSACGGGSVGLAEGSSGGGSCDDAGGKHLDGEERVDGGRDGKSVDLVFDENLVVEGCDQIGVISRNHVVLTIVSGDLSGSLLTEEIKC